MRRIRYLLGAHLLRVGRILHVNMRRIRMSTQDLWQVRSVWLAELMGQS